MLEISKSTTLVSAVYNPAQLHRYISSPWAKFFFFFTQPAFWTVESIIRDVRVFVSLSVVPPKQLLNHVEWRIVVFFAMVC